MKTREIVDHMSHRQMGAQVREIVSDFYRTDWKTEMIRQSRGEINPNQLVGYIHHVVNNMPEDYRRILVHDYLCNDEKPDWWMEFYSRTTYYRYKIKAIREFLLRYAAH